jgi:hypothetical protein
MKATSITSSSALVILIHQVFDMNGSLYDIPSIYVKDSCPREDTDLSFIVLMSHVCPNDASDRLSTSSVPDKSQTQLTRLIHQIHIFLLGNLSYHLVIAGARQERLTKTPCFGSITTSTSRLPLFNDQRIVLPILDGEAWDHRNLL